MSSPPVPPGQLTVAPSAAEAQAFLAALEGWTAGLHATLDRLDADAQLVSEPALYTSDITLAMALCQSISVRRDELNAVWDSGRVGPDELAALAVLMWNRLPDPLGASTAFTITEAGTLAAALTDRLTVALAADGSSLLVSTAARFTALTSRYTEFTERAVAIEQLAERCRSRMSDAPDLAVPSIRALGPPPLVALGHGSDEHAWAAARGRLDEYAARLEELAAVLDEIEVQFTLPLRARDDLRGLLGAYETRAARSGLAEDHTLTAAYRAAHEVLWSAPCDLAVANELVERYQHAVRAAVGAERAVEPFTKIEESA